MKISSDDDAVLLLTHVNKFTYRDLFGLIDLGIRPSEFVNSPEAFIEKVSASNLHLLIADIQAVRESLEISKIRKSCAQKNLQLLSVLSQEYPQLLKEIFNPPLMLYVKGKLIPEDFLSLAIVGARHASAYGLRVAHRFAYDLASSGLTVVSGLAKGIDAEAHRGALEARGRTIAVLGSGIDVIYPKENMKLYEQISEQGAVISEFPIGSEPLAFRFPIRNRIIAGLAQGVLVVEAHERSGSLITAGLALDSGREVYAIPGSVDSLGSRGTNQLIKQGAKMALAPEDILEDLKLVFRDVLKSEKTIETLQKSGPILTQDEELILKLISESERSFNEMKERSGFAIATLSVILFKLEAAQLIEKAASGLYNAKSVLKVLSG